MAISPNNIRQLPPVCDGLTIIVQGQILPNAQGFAVNLCTGPNFPQCDAALHVNPRYNQNNVVVRNSLLGGAWGNEERDGPQFQVARGQQCECILLVQNDVIKVAFNGQHNCEFRHRMPKERINHVVISGDMIAQNITFYGPTVPPMGLHAVPGGAPGGGYGYPMVGASTAPGGLPQPAVPYYPPSGGPGVPVPAGYPQPSFPQPGSPGKQFVPGGLFPGRLIYITATPGPSQFAVNLRFQEQGGDIAFHFNPRVKDGVVVRNSFFSDSWGPEEKAQPSFPFQAGQQFTMIILCELNQFKVAVNNQHFIEYKHRNPNLQAIQWVEVVAEATVASIFVQ